MSAKILGRIIRPSTNTKGDYSQIENIQLQVFTALDVPKNSPQGQTVQNSEELQKTQKLVSKEWTSMACLGLQGKESSL